MCFLLCSGLFVSQGGWGEGKKKARGGRWARFRSGSPFGGESSPCHFQARQDENQPRLFSCKFFTQSKVKNNSLERVKNKKLPSVDPQGVRALEAFVAFSA